MHSDVGGTDYEEVGHDGVNGGGLVEGRHNCWSVVAAWCWCLPCQGSADGDEDFPLEDQHHQLQVLVGDGAARIGKTDQMPDDVGRPLNLPDNASTIFVWFNTYPPSNLSRGVGVE